MLDQLRDLHRRLGEALALLEPLQGLLEGSGGVPLPPGPPQWPERLSVA